LINLVDGRAVTAPEVDNSNPLWRLQCQQIAHGAIPNIDEISLLFSVAINDDLITRNI